MYDKLLKIVKNLPSPRVLLVGDFMLDSYIYGDALRISPEAPVPVLKVVKKEYRCGGAGSVAADLAALGAKVSCLGIIGNDHNGTFLSNMLASAGADTSDLLTVPGRPTISKQRIIGLAQHRHRQQLMRVDEESSAVLDAATCSALVTKFEKLLSSTDIVCLQDHNKNFPVDFFRSLITASKKAGRKIMVDPAPVSDFSRYAGATIITPNRKEASLAVGFDINTIDDAEKAANLLFEKFNFEAVVITLDKEGAFLKTQAVSEHIPTIAKMVYDVTGAGDCVLSTITVAAASGCDYLSSIQLANIAAGIEVEKFGTDIVTIDEIINELIARNREKSGKLRQIASLQDELNWHRSRNRTVVFTNGCFDVIHRGHIEYLKFCKTLGHVVVLGLNSDNSVRQLKGPTRPVNNQLDRAEVLSALEAIDYIVIFDELDPLSLIMQVKPDILVKGKDWENKGVVGREFVESYGGKVVLAELVEGKSSTATIAKLKAIESAEKKVSN
jgi:D-beta-D-heptose 7-phosphate kinase/D-beta-D-heptose 1-phosphate adenosyltransferase